MTALPVRRIKVCPPQRSQLPGPQSCVRGEQDDRRHFVAEIAVRVARHARKAVDLGLRKCDQILPPLRRLEPKVGERVVLADAIAERVSPHRARRACRVPRPLIRPGARRWAINGSESEAADVADDLFDRSQIRAHCSTVIDEPETGWTVASASASFASPRVANVPSQR